MTTCCCLACIEGFGQCSSAPKSIDRLAEIVQSNPIDTYSGITRADPHMLDLCAPYSNSAWWQLSANEAPDLRNLYTDPQAPSIIVESTARGIADFKPPTKQKKLKAMAKYFGLNHENVKPWYEDKI